MYLVRLIYASEVCEGFNSGDIEQILTVARSNNHDLKVTGLLCFSRKYFLQCLEGSRRNVNTIYHRILNDKRHQNPLLLDYNEISARDFSDWSMGYMPEASMTTALNMKYSGSPEFNPYEMFGDSCHQLMVELRNTVPVI